MYLIKGDNQTKYITEFKMNVPVSSPVFFSKDFRRHIKFEYKSKDRAGQGDQQNRDDSNGMDGPQGKSRLNIVVYQTIETIDQKTKIKQFSKFEPMRDLCMPEFDQIKKNKQGKPFIFFKSNDVICYIDNNDVEQSVPLETKESLLGDQSSIQEYYLPPDKLAFRTFYDALNFKEE